MVTPTRWGFMGCGNMANDFATAMQLLPNDEHKIVAVGARELKRSKEFADKFQIEHAFEGYEKVANCPDVDIVYVNVIIPGHLHCVKLALNAGKSVLCETPMGMNAEQVREMIRLARQKNLFLMEAHWSRCFPVYEEIRQALKGGRIGEPKFLQGTMGMETEVSGYQALVGFMLYGKWQQGPMVFIGHHNFGPQCGYWASVLNAKACNSHPFEKEMGGSCALAFGSYSIMLTTMIFDGQRPELIKASGKLDNNGIDIIDCVTLNYKNGAVVQWIMSAEVLTMERAIVFGTKGSLELPERFYCPTKVIINSKLIEHALPDSNGTEYMYPNYQALSYEIGHVRECLLKGLKESPLMPLEHTDVIVSIVDEIRRQVGCVYPDSV